MTMQPLPVQPYDLTPNKVVILDRDGVINEDSENYIKSLEEWRPYPQAIEAIARLSLHGWTVAVATNQSGLARGYFDEATLQLMHDNLCERVSAAGGSIAHIAYCPHGPDDDCACRKPKVGLLDQIQQRLNLENLRGAWMVGDSGRDLEAGIAKGCHPVLVRTGKGKKTEARENLERVWIFDDLAAFVDHLIEAERRAPQ
ncbi:D-glycero-beta-D-manno-heptose 1,7-bisphosphate 7-phosphatase [Halomonas sp. HP20-15]|uniref:D-glycero-beta-D-manno-heptose 1,7-bisphosphate 7-phosphatase n=1 Tax=Halomonas sp. HP20-15 TaxID=3085901 RepID=UPI0029813461|nr:D-glycero-beta-D-manno-heptose 1,7-bisphosphate 7-phosphatase [Halomonas sp. HP20-15]MDW5375939.1 D-glycero-beta-D-manno-heptose 1,7-bisphosphate 7-phosphatase [Halomonas sp. HP20-15]